MLHRLLGIQLGLGSEPHYGRRTVAALRPTLWMPATRAVEPSLALFGPKLRVPVAAILHERQPPAVRDRISIDLESRDLDLMWLALVVVSAAAVGRPHRERSPFDENPRLVIERRISPVQLDARLVAKRTTWLRVARVVAGGRTRALGFPRLPPPTCLRQVEPLQDRLLMLPLVLGHHPIDEAAAQQRIVARRINAREHGESRLPHFAQILERRGRRRQGELGAGGARVLEGVVKAVTVRTKLAVTHGAHQPELLEVGDVSEVPDDRAEEITDLATQVILGQGLGELQCQAARPFELLGDLVPPIHAATIAWGPSLHFSSCSYCGRAEDRVHFVALGRPPMARWYCQPAMRQPVVLITGAAGEIGHALIHRLAENGSDALATIDLDPLDEGLASRVSRAFTGSILDRNLLETIQAEYAVDRIYHLAALLSTRSEFAPITAHEVNVTGTLNLLEFAMAQGRSHGRRVMFFYPSSIAAYGVPADLDDRPLREHEYTNPITMYGCNKLYCENLGRYFARHYKQLDVETHAGRVDFRAIRFPGLISAVTMPAGGTSDYAPEMIHAAAKEAPYPCFVRPDTRIPLMAMPDAIDAIFALTEAATAELTQRVYNVSAFNPTAEEIRDLVVQAYPNAKITFEPDERRQAIVDSWPGATDDSAARRDWGLSPRFDLERSFVEYLIPTISGLYR